MMTEATIEDLKLAIESQHGGTAKVALSFEDPQRMFTALPEARRRLLIEVMREHYDFHRLLYNYRLS